MSIYVRLQTSFWQHRKTMRLRGIIGDDAFWIPPRLWSYAAQNQPDGDFSDYSASELALLLGYHKDAQAMLEALQQARFLDEMKIHGWEEHNGYHGVFADRAKKAAAARWEKERSKEKEGKDKTRQEVSIASSMLEAFEEFWSAYPKKKSKGDAEKAWKKGKCDSMIPLILTAIRTAKASYEWTKEGGQFIPYPASWLNSKGWEDDYTPIRLNGVKHDLPEYAAQPHVLPPNVKPQHIIDRENELRNSTPP